MSSLRRVLVVLGLLLLAASLCLLVVANLPNQHLQDRQSLPVEDLTLPTPEAGLPLMRAAPVGVGVQHASPPSGYRL